LGVFSFTVDTLLGIAMVANILVINSVKFFFEFMVWLTPIPLVDAVFEVCNKGVCACLMGIYAFSPTLATAINLVILLAAAVVLRWISRRVRFYRTMVLDPILAKLWSGFGRANRPELIVFPQSAIGPFAPKSRLRLMRSADDSGKWLLQEANWWMPSKQHHFHHPSPPKVRCGWVMNSIELQSNDGDVMVLRFSRRYGEQELLPLLRQLGLESQTDDKPSPAKMAHEFA
jgi:hypothetical protein